VRKSRWLILAVACVSLSATALAWGGRDGDGDAVGRITRFDVKNPFAVVEGTTSKGKLWLAYTVVWKDGKQIDYQPIRVKGSFRETLTFQARPQGLSRVIVCLWRYKVSKSRCVKERGDGTACKSCKNMGFHMAGHQDRRSES
jgi:hypothetical protein